MQTNYSNQEAWTGTEFLAAKFPSVAPGARLGGYLEEAKATKTKPIIDEANVLSLGSIPPEHLVKSALGLFDTKNTEEGYIHITKVAFFTRQALIQLAKVHAAMNFAAGLWEMMTWLEEGADDDDGTFISSLRRRLLKQRNLITYAFISSYGVRIRTQSVLFFSGEKWIDDYAIDGALATLLRKHPEESLYEWDWNKNTVLTMLKEASKKKDVRAYTVANLG
ncbi:hypothetical protein BGZ65_004321, partial [Modicella reniformis]